MAFDFFKKWKKKAQSSARQGYKSYKSDQQKQRKRKVVTSNYDQARQKQKPTQSGGSSSRYSNNRSASRSGGTAQHRGVQNQQRRPQPEKKKHQNTWQEHVQKTLDTKKNKTQNSALDAYKKMKDADTNALGAKSKTRVVNTSQGNLKSRDLNREEYLKVQNASRIGGKVGTRSLGKELAEKVGSRTAYSAKKGRVATGIMQGMAYGDVLEGGVGTYNKKARAAVEDVKKSTAYNLGYGAGQMAGFALSGTSSAARALASGGAKAAGKAAAKAGAKQAAKTAAKSTAKTTGKKVGEDLVKESAKKAAETAGKKSAKKFIKNRAIESAVESPMNMVDAVKMSRDENGKINKKKLAGYMALNTGLTAGAGGMMEGAAMKFTKNEGKKLIALQAKANKGGLTEKEGQTLQKLYSKLDTARKDTASAKSDLAAVDYAKGRKMVAENRLQRKKATSEARENTKRIARTEAENAKVERAMAQSAEGLQKSKNERINNQVADYVSKVNESNRAVANVNEAVYRNRDAIDAGDFVDSSKQKVPNVERRPAKTKADPEAVENARKSVRESLTKASTDTTKFTSKETKEIDGTISKISNMIAHGDVADARAEARNLARKHGRVDREIVEEIPDAKRLRQEYNRARHELMARSVTMAGDTRPIREFLEAFGTTPEDLGRKLKIRKGRGTLQTESMDYLYPDLANQYPEVFPPNITDETGRWQRVIDVALTKADDTPTHKTYELTDDEYDQMFKDMEDEIFSAAEKNADSFKSTAKNAEEPNAPVGENALPTSTENKAASDKAMGGMDSAMSDAEHRMQQAKNARTNKEVDEYLAKLNKEEPNTPKEKAGEFVDEKPEPKEEPKAETKSEAKPETEKGSEARGDLPNPRDMDEKQLKAEARRLRGGTKRKGYLKNTEQKYGADSPRAKEMREHLQEVEERLDDIAHEKKTGQKTRRTDDPVPKQKGAEATLDEPRTRIGKAFRGLYRVAVDSEADIERLARKIGGETGQDLLAAGNAFRNARNIAGSFIKTGRSTFDRQPSGKALDDIFKPLNKNKTLREDAVNYSYLLHNLDRTLPQGELDELADLKAMVKRGEDLDEEAAERLKELKDRDKPIAGMPRSKEETQQAIDDLKANLSDDAFKKVETFQQDIVKYADDMLQYKVDAGVVSKEEAKKLRDAYKNYIPSFTNKEFSGVVHETKNTDVTIDRGLKAAKGAGIDDELVDLYSQMVQVTRSTVKHCEMNELIRTLGDAQGIKYADIDKALTPDEVLENSIFIKKQAGSGKKAFFFKDGKRYEVPLTDDMYMGLREMTGEEKAILVNNPFNSVMMRPMRIFKGLITDWNVLFGVRNGVRDLATALTYTKDIRGFIKAYPKAIRAIATKDDYYKAYIAAGGEFSTLAKQSGRDHALKAIEDGKMSPLKWANEINGVIEMMPRMQEFISTIDKAGVSPNMAGRKVIDKAMRNANDVTLNFGRSGILGKALNTGAVPYLNPSLQGLDKLIRVFVEAKNEKNMRGIISLGMKMSTFAIAPSVFNEWMLRNDEDYQQLNTRDKDNNYFIPLGKITGNEDDKGKFIKIPKARELVVGAEPFQYFFRYAQFGDSGGWKQMFKTAVDNVGVINPISDNFFSPLIRMATNKTWFGGNIESSQDLDLPTQDRYDETTSLIGIKLGQTAVAKALKLSPKKIDNLIDSYTGIIGDYMLPKFAEASKGNPFINQFITDSVFSNKLSAETWENYNDLKEKMNSKSLSKDEKLKATYDYQDLSNKYIDDACKISAAISQVQGDKSLTKDEKATIARTLRKYQNEFYRSAKDGSEPTLDGKEVDALQAIYKSLHAKKGAKAIDIAFSVASEDMQKAYSEYTKYLEHEGKSKKEIARAKKKFLDYSVDIRKTNGKIGETKDKYISYKTAAVVGAIKGYSENMQNAYMANDETKATAKTYGKEYGYPLDHYIYTERTNLLASRELGLKYKSDMQSHDIAMAQATKENDDGSYYIGDAKPYYQKGRMPAARYLAKTDKKQWTKKEIHDFAEKHDFNYKSDYDEVYKQARKTYANYSDLECAAVAQVITNKGYNDFGDTALKDDSGIMGTVYSGYGGGWGRRRGRRGWGRRRHGRGGGGDAALTNASTWEDYVAGMTPKEEKKKSEKKAASAPASVKINPSSPVKANKVNVSKAYNSKVVNANKVKASKAVSSKVHFTDNTKRSELTEAYIKRQQRRLKKNRG